MTGPSAQQASTDRVRSDAPINSAETGRRDSALNWRPPVLPLQHSFAQPVYSSNSNLNGNYGNFEGTAGNFMASAGSIDVNGTQGSLGDSAYMQGAGPVQGVDTTRMSINSYDPPNMGAFADFSDSGSMQNATSGTQQQHRLHGNAAFQMQQAAMAGGNVPQDMSGLYPNLDHLFEPLVGAEENVTMLDFDLQDFWSKVGPGEVRRCSIGRSDFC